MVVGGFRSFLVLVLASGRHVRMFVGGGVLSKLKGFSFIKGKVKEVIVQIRSSLHYTGGQQILFHSIRKVLNT